MPDTPPPVTRETTSHLPPVELETGVTSIGQNSAHVAVMSRKGKAMNAVVNEWAWWQSALANPSEIGKSLPVHDGDPQQGYYRTRYKGGKWEPVAIWNENGVWLALRSNNPVRADEIWTFCCKNPISYEAYEKAATSGEWDDEPVARGMGDNLPSDPFEALTLEFDGERELADEFLKTPITEQTQADRAAVLAKRIAGIAKKATDLHKREKEPHWLACQAVDSKWRPLKEEPDALSKRIKRHMDAYLLEQQRLEQERQRLAREEAERIRMEAEEAERALVASAAESQEDARHRLAEAERLANEAKLAEREAQARSTAVGRTGAKVSLRTFVSAKVTDYRAAANALVDMQHKEFLEFIDQLANRAIRADKTLPGVERVEEQRAA